MHNQEGRDGDLRSGFQHFSNRRQKVEDSEGSTMSRPAKIPAGCWPRRMPVEIAAGYCGEPSAEAFISRLGKEYPQPTVNEGRRRLWLRDDLDRAILPPELAHVADVGGDL